MSRSRIETVEQLEAALSEPTEAAVEMMRRTGGDIVFLGDHGGYQKDEQAVADRLNREWASAPRKLLPAGPSDTTPGQYAHWPGQPHRASIGLNPGGARDRCMHACRFLTIRQNGPWRPTTRMEAA